MVLLFYSGLGKTEKKVLTRKGNFKQHETKALERIVNCIKVIFLRAITFAVSKCFIKWFLVENK